MDRIITQPGAIPLDSDLLNAQKNAMLSDGWFMSMVMGSATAVEGLGCVPTSPPSMAVQINPGMLCQGSTIDSTQYGSLPLGTDNVSPLVKAGILPSYDPTTMLFTLAAPTVSGQSINYLIEASLLEVDDLPLVLPYYNAANPLQALLGPNGNGTSVFTRRRQKVQLQLKAGVPAVDGFQTTPSADAGWVPLWIITVKFGDTSINSSRIVKHPAAPFVVNKLPQLQPLLGGRIRSVLLGTTNLYISPTGSNSNDGKTPAAPFQTLQYAIDYMSGSLDLNNQNVVINVAAGNYASGAIMYGLPVGYSSSTGAITINGAGPSTIFAASNGSPCVTAKSGAILNVSNMQVGASGIAGNYSAAGSALYADTGGIIALGQGVIFGASGQSHMLSSRGGVITSLGNPYTIAGGAVFHLNAGSGATLDIVASRVTLTGTPNFSVAYAAAGPLGTLSAWGCTFVGSATGPRYLLDKLGCINVQGAGVNYFPGSSAGAGAGDYF
jgi:hypothetical protein